MSNKIKSSFVKSHIKKVTANHLFKVITNQNNILKKNKNYKIERDLQRLENFNKTLVKGNSVAPLSQDGIMPVNSDDIDNEKNPKVNFSKDDINKFNDAIGKKEFSELETHNVVYCQGGSYNIDTSFINEEYIEKHPLSDEDISEIIKDTFIHNYSFNFDKESKIKLEQNKNRFNLEQKIAYKKFDKMKSSISRFMRNPISCDFEHTKEINNNLKQIMYSIIMRMKENKEIKNGDEKWALFFYNKIKSLSEDNFRNELCENIKVLYMLNKITNCFKTEEIKKRDSDDTNTVAKDARFYVFNELIANRVFENSKSDFTSFHDNYKKELENYLMDGIQKFEIESGILYKIDQLKEPEKKYEEILNEDDEKSISRLRFYAAESWCTTNRDSAINYLNGHDSFIFQPKKGNRKLRIECKMEDGKLKINLITNLENTTEIQYEDLEHLYEFVKFNRNKGIDVDTRGAFSLSANAKLNPYTKDILNDIAPSEIYTKYNDGILRAAFQDEVKVDSEYQNKPVKKVQLDRINNVEAQDNLLELEELNLSLCNHINFRNLKNVSSYLTIKNSSEMETQEIKLDNLERARFLKLEQVKNISMKKLKEAESFSLELNSEEYKGPQLSNPSLKGADIINLDSLEKVNHIKFEHVNNISMKNLKEVDEFSLKLNSKELEELNLSIPSLKKLTRISIQSEDEYLGCQKELKLDSLEDVNFISFQHVTNVSMKNLKNAKGVTFRLTLKELENLNFDISNIDYIQNVNFEIIDKDFQDSELYKYLFPQYECGNYEEREEAIRKSLNYFKENQEKYKGIISIMKNSSISGLTINDKCLQNREDIFDF